MVTTNIDSIEIQHDDAVERVTLAPNQYNPENLTLIDSFLQGDMTYLPGVAKPMDSGELVIEYTIPDGYVPLLSAMRKARMATRLATAIRLMRLADMSGQLRIPYLEPQNCFVSDEDFRIGHRGAETILAPMRVDAESYLTSLRALVIVTVRPKLAFANVLAGMDEINDPLSRKLAQAADADELLSVLNQAYEEADRGMGVVSLQRYRLYRALAVAATLLTLTLGGILIYNAGVSAPLQARVIKSLGDYASGNYANATGGLKDDDPKKLTAATQYVLAISYVKQDNLSPKQKETIVSGLSPKTTKNTLLYWINLGRGEFGEALNLAKNVGDNQLILYAYTKLYDATVADTTLSGAKKQERLDDYKKNIEKYTKALGGESDGQTRY